MREEGPMEAMMLVAGGPILFLGVGFVMPFIQVAPWPTLTTLATLAMM